AKVAQAYGALPLSFEANQGQTDAAVDFLTRGDGYNLFLTPTEAVFSFQADRAAAGAAEAPAEPAPLRMRLLGSNPAAQAVGTQPLPGKTNYFIGNDPSRWRTNISTYAKVLYRGAFPGVDLAFYGNQGALEYDFIVAPGADPASIRLGFEGTDSLAVDPRGDLVLNSSRGELRQQKPRVYQLVGDTRREVAGDFVMKGEREVAFQVAAYDLTRPLVIDPVLVYSTFIGGKANDFGFGIAVDGAGNAYLGGSTGSAIFPRGCNVVGGGCTTVDFPLGDPAPGFDTSPNGGGDAYVLKMNPAGTALVYRTFLGGSASEQGFDVAIDAAGNAYIAGSTTSDEGPTGYPTTPSGFDLTCDSCPAEADAFLTKLNPAGTALAYSTYLGGSSAEQTAADTPYSGQGGLEVHGTKAYIASITTSSDFPATAGAIQPVCGSCATGASDAFLTVIDTALVGAPSLAYSTFIGGSGADEAKDVAVDGSGRAYVTGFSIDLLGNGAAGFPIVLPAPGLLPAPGIGPVYTGGYSDAFLVKIDPGGPPFALLSGFIGGGGLEEGWSVAVGPGETIYLTGYTTSGPNPNPPLEAADQPGACSAPPTVVTSGPFAGLVYRPYCDPARDPLPYFPTTYGSYQPSFNGRATTDSGSTLFLDGDAFVMKLSALGTIAYSTFLGGPNSDYGQEIEVDSLGQAYVVGWTTCRQTDNPAIVGITPSDAFPHFYRDVEIAGVPSDGVPPGGAPDGLPTGQEAGEPTLAAALPRGAGVSGVADCASAAGQFPQVDPVPGEASMDTTFLGLETHNSPTGVFHTKLNRRGSAVHYSVVLDGPGFDRGFGIALRETGGTTEVYLTGRTGRQGYPTTPGAYDTTYNGAGRDAFISKLSAPTAF
ncbi:MAG: SBBP repeat-containing protein, partial [Acidimicrobiales bacterium]